MTLRDLVITAMSDAYRVLEYPDGVQVTTHCLYPSNAFVDVVVRGGRDTFVVSDEGKALREIELAGAVISRPDKTLKYLNNLVRSRGLQFHNGIIKSPFCKREALPIAITMVANTSREVADWLFSHVKIKRERDFKMLLKQFLKETYMERVRQDTIVGKSNKPHKFDYLIRIGDHKRIIVDPVVYDQNAINARVVANMDVRLAEHPGLEQRIIYDDAEDWKPEDLSLLQVGASVVKFSNIPSVLQRLTTVH